VLTLAFDGIAYGMLLFIMACGLSVTLGLMNFINLAHGAFAMAGGYATALLMNHFGAPFFACLPIAFIATAVAGVILERLLYQRLYDKSHLDQVLFSIGIVFMSVSGVDYLMGSQQQIINLPEFLQRRIEYFGINFGVYRTFIILICGAVALLLQTMLTKTRFGSQLRASVDDRRVARGVGIHVNTVFALTFAVGSGLAGLGGALGAEVMPLDPNFPLKYMVYFLIVVTVGGTSGIVGPLVASLMLGIADVMGKYFIPSLGAFFVYALLIAVLVARPQGLFARAR
jgi:branched-chain amino acid transport system permease protein